RHPRDLSSFPTRRSSDLIEIHYHTEAKEILGNEQGVKGVLVFNNQTGEERTLDVTGFFVAIGHKPNTELFEGIIDMDKNGYLIRSEEHTSELQSRENLVC